MRSRAAHVMTGPISMSGASPGPVVTRLARSASFVTSESATSPTATTAEIAMQRSPAEP